MSNSKLSRRRAIQVAGAAAVTTVLLGSGASSVPAGLIETTGHQEQETQKTGLSKTKEQGMNLGAFSVSLAVKDLKVSREFYEKFGFKPFAGNPAQNWQILKNGEHVIGLFQGMFEKNILTFNPGWDQDAEKVAAFTDVRDLQRQLKAQGVKLTLEADENTKGPASFMAVDPDGNSILVDQHV